MSAQKRSYEQTLQEEVIENEICAGCTACVLVCPFGCLEYFDEKPNLIKKCEVCGICPRVCPRFEFSEAVLEKLVFQRERKADEEFGICERLVIARAADENVLRASQDGGLVSALLIYALNNGVIDSAILSGTNLEKPFFPVPKLVSTTSEILACAGTRYTYSPNLLMLQEAVKQKRQSVAFVSTPCQIQAIRRIEGFPLKKYSSMVKFTIGLMCTESFTYTGLMERHIEETLGVDLHDVKKINIKGKVLITTRAGETKSIPLQEAKRYTRNGCLPCTDFSSELADISTGGLGLSGWTFTVLRTKKGRDLFEGAERAGVIQTRPVEEERGALELLIKLSRKKRKTG